MFYSNHNLWIIRIWLAIKFDSQRRYIARRKKHDACQYAKYI